MQQPHRHPASRRASASLPRIVLLLCLATGAASVSHAAEWRTQRQALMGGQATLERAALQQFDAAFAQAGELGRAGDPALQKRLESQKQLAAESATRLGAVRSLSSPEEQFFAGCITRSYFVRYSEGSQRWLLKFRRGNAGWYLSDLDVRPS